jgi:hypothetical protein
MTKRKSQSVEKQPVVESVVITEQNEPQTTNHIWGIGTLNDSTFSWYMDTTGVVFHTSDIRVANTQCDEVNRRYGSSKTVYVVREMR